MKKPNIYAKHALLEMHATLAGEMQRSNEHFFKIVKEMRAIESAIKMMDPTFKINRIAVRRPQPNNWLKRGTIARTCLEVLRRAGKPLTVREIMDAAFIAKGYDPDKEKIAKVRVVFNTALRNQVGKAIRVIRDGPTVRWELVDNPQRQ
jgi:hypothetical protein